MVTIRSSAGMKPLTTLSVVVLPDPVPPQMTMFRRPRTQTSISSATPRGKVPNPTRSSTVKGSRANLRMVRMLPSRAMGCTTALTREPSGSRASTMGLASSTRRPTRPTILSMVRRRWASLENRAVTGWICPARST